MSIRFTPFDAGSNAYSFIPQAVFPLKKCFLIHGKNSFAAAGQKLLSALSGKLEIVESACYLYPTYDRCEELAKRIKALHAELVIGMGGGRALDTAKGSAFLAQVPCITCPTISATCAAVTKLSVLYHKGGEFDRFLPFDTPPLHAFIDLSVLADAPYPFMRAGMGDAIAKYCEVEFASRGKKLNYSDSLALTLSKGCGEPLFSCGPQALEDCKAHRITEALQTAVLASIITTGMVSVLVQEDYNGALAHSLYYALSPLPGFDEKNLHGDAVAYGAMVEKALDEDYDAAEKIFDFLISTGAPYSMKTMAVNRHSADYKNALKEMLTLSDLNVTPYPILIPAVEKAIDWCDERAAKYEETQV